MLLDCSDYFDRVRGTYLEDIFEKLSRFDLYHLLVSQSSSDPCSGAEWLKQAPEDYLDWIDICGGGSLQICELLGENTIDIDTELPLESYGEYEKSARDDELPDGYHIFAVADFGDYYCFKVSGDETADPKVYQWGLHEGEFVYVWDSFSEWLSEEVAIWVDMIETNVLTEIPMKADGSFHM